MTAANPNQTTDPAALREEITQTRQELAQTVQELAARVDVPARARATARRTAARMREAGGTGTPWLVVAASAAAVALITILIRQALVNTRQWPTNRSVCSSARPPN